jgi:putative protease
LVTFRRRAAGSQSRFARARGLTSASLREQFGRLGDTPYELADLHLEIRGAPFAPVSILNDLRRRAVEALQQAQALPPRRTIQPVAITPPSMAADTPAPRLHLLVRAPAQLEAALAVRPASITLDYLDLYGLRPSIERVKAAGIEARVASPRVLKPGEERIADFLHSLECGILIRSTGLIEDLRGARVALTGDASLNVSNT